MSLRAAVVETSLENGCMKHLAGNAANPRIGDPAGVVLAIPGNRISHLGKMSSNLMRATGLDLDVQERGAVALCQRTPVSGGGSTVESQGTGPFPGRMADDDGPVDFADLLIAELLDHALECFLRAGKTEAAAGVLVDAVHRSDQRIQFVLLIEGLGAFGAVGKEAGWFVDDKDISGIEQDRCTRGLLLGGWRGFLLEFDAIRVADRVFCHPNPLAVNKDDARIQQGFCLPQ